MTRTLVAATSLAALAMACGGRTGASRHAGDSRAGDGDAGARADARRRDDHAEPPPEHPSDPPLVQADAGVAPATPASPMAEAATYHVVLAVRGMRTCVPLVHQPERNVLLFHSEHGRHGNFNITPTADGFRIVGAGGSGTREGFGLGGEAPDEVYRITETSPERVTTDRGVLYREEAACQAGLATTAMLDLGRFEQLVFWVFPAPVDPRTDRLARAMRGGRAVFRSDVAPACARWRFVPTAPGGLDGNLETRERRGAELVVRSQTYAYDPTTGTLSLTDEGVEVFRDGRAVSAMGTGGFDVTHVTDDGGPALAGAWFLRRADCERAAAAADRPPAE